VGNSFPCFPCFPTAGDAVTRIHLVSSRATTAPCPRCRRPTLVALDEGLPARVDTAPLDRDGEIAALLSDRWTYSLTPSGDLIHRDPSRIADATQPGTIHAAHRCTTAVQLEIDCTNGQI
jgi:hypothetical protein